MNNQKFPRGSFVKVADKLPPMRRFHPSGFVGIIEYTYGQRFNGEAYDQYSIIRLDDDDNPINSIAWYNEDDLILVDDNVTKGKRIIESYRFE